MKKDSVEVSEFYDNYIENQKQYSFNDRHYLLIDKMLNYGLKPNSNVLELGCGIGVMTSLMSKKVVNGKIVSCDISEQSIELAKANNNLKHIEFFVTDIAKFEYKDFKFDFITFFDVLEHIPVDKHFDIFKNIYKYMNDNSKLLISIPTEEIITYLKKEKPESLQIIDQAIPIEFLINNLAKAGFRLIKFEVLNIWQEMDYQFLVLTKKQGFKNVYIDKPKKSIIKRLFNKFR
jgi:cyclopropane fatty-acyl-phospholipid synthase-like methyltransferase